MVHALRLGAFGDEDIRIINSTNQQPRHLTHRHLNPQLLPIDPTPHLALPMRPRQRNLNRLTPRNRHLSNQRQTPRVVDFNPLLADDSDDSSLTTFRMNHDDGMIERPNTLHHYDDKTNENTHDAQAFNYASHHQRLRGGAPSVTYLP